MLVAVTVALVALATVIVFDIGDSVGDTADATVDVSETEEGAQVNLVREENLDELRIEYGEDEVETIDNIGETVNLDEQGPYTVIGVTEDGTEEVLNTGEIEADIPTFEFETEIIPEGTKEIELVSTDAEPEDSDRLTWGGDIQNEGDPVFTDAPLTQDGEVINLEEGITVEIFEQVLDGDEKEVKFLWDEEFVIATFDVSDVEPTVG